MSDYQGRGAWPSKGTGGTLKKTSTGAIVPGPYYLLHKDPNQRIGLIGFLNLAAGRAAELNYNATFHGVVAIQVLLSNYLGEQVPVNGVYDAVTDMFARKAQGKLGLKADGIVGSATMKKLLLPVIQAKATAAGEPFQPIYGILQFEGGFDPSAVGYSDSNDWGLVQINCLAHPEVSLSDAFCPSFAIQFAINKIQQGLNAFNGDIRDAIASYNLGVGGTREWIADGRPDIWQPSWATTPRYVKKYIDNILSAYQG